MSKKLGILLTTLLVFIVLFPSQILMLKPGLYNGYDVRVHVERINQFHLAIVNDQFPPRIAPTIVNGNGYPLFVVNYQFPYYIAEGFMLLNNNAALAYKAVMSATFLLSGYFAFLLFRKYGAISSSIVGAVVYTYLPFRFGNLYFRGAIGESVSLMFVPLILLFLHRINVRLDLNFMVLTFAIFGLITSNPLIFLIFLPFFILYTLYISKPKGKLYKYIGLSLLLAILASSFQTLPMLFEKQFLTIDQSLLGIYQGQFINIYQLLRIPVADTNLGTHIQVGILPLILIIFSLIAFKIKPKKELLIFILSIFVSIYLITEQSSWIWSLTPLKYVMFPWRFLSVTILATAFLSVFLLEYLKNKNIKLFVSLILIIFTIFSSRHYFLNSGNPNSIPTTPSLASFGEFDTIWSNYKTHGMHNLIEVKNNSSITNISESPYIVSFEIATEEPSSFQVRRIFFPGWKMDINSTEQQIIYKNGFINGELGKGKSFVTIYFEESGMRTLGNGITIIFLLFIILFPIFSGHKSKLFKAR